MIYFLLAVILILAVLLLAQYRVNIERSRSLIYICSKLNGIISCDTGEKLLLFTQDNELISLLVELNNLIEAKQKALVDFVKAEVSMKKMLSNISHDLRTPLTVVLGYIETLRLSTGISDEEMAILLQRVQDKTLEVLDLLNRFFDLAKLESGDKNIPLSKVNMNEVCRKSILSFYDILTSQNFEVAIDIPENNIYALANEEALERILNNLISNAVKYGYEGKTVGLSLRNDDKYVCVSVWDKGRGISEAYKDLVFDRMYTVDDSRSKLSQGSGLGLAITKRLVEKLGGEISLQSKPHDMTVFSFRIKRFDF